MSENTFITTNILTSLYERLELLKEPEDLLDNQEGVCKVIEKLLDFYEARVGGLDTKSRTILNIFIKRVMKSDDVKTQTMAEGLEDILRDTPDEELKAVLDEWRDFFVKHADDDELKVLYKTITCDSCSYEWKPRKPRPVACPNCKTRFKR